MAKKGKNGTFKNNKQMAQTFRIATSSKLDTFNVIGDKSKVSEQIFWNILKSKVKELTADVPDKYDEAFKMTKDFLLSGQSKNITIMDTWFEIKGRP